MNNLHGPVDLPTGPCFIKTADNNFSIMSTKNKIKALGVGGITAAVTAATMINKAKQIQDNLTFTSKHQSKPIVYY